MKKTRFSPFVFLLAFLLNSCTSIIPITNQCRVSTSIGSNSNASICIECYLMNQQQIDQLKKIMPKKWLKIAN